ncbi:MAG: adenosine deaminase [Acidimicrobiales bacterium]|jgi:adenosine deaminase
MSDIAAFIRGLPKIELHLHIEGSLEPELRFALAQRNRTQLAYADVAELRASYRFNDLTSFLVSYYEGMEVLVTADDFYDLAWAYLRRANDENVRYVEMFFDPQAHTSRGVAFGRIVGGLRRAIVDARQQLGVRAELIMCFLRDYPAEYAMATLVQSLPYREWIVGVGLDSDERDNPPTKFAEVFARARSEGYQITMHCDVDQNNTVEHIRQCLDVIGVDRIDHGVNVLESEELTMEVGRRGLGLTTCPISNRWVTGDLKAAEIKRLLEFGLRVTVNSDDPAYFGAYVTDNLVALQEAADLGPAELVQLERNAIEISWLPSRAKDELITEIERYADMR